MEKLKVLFVIRSLLRAGAERMLINICNEMVKRDHLAVAIYFFFPENEFQDALDSRVIVKGGDAAFHFSLYKKDRFKNENYISFLNSFQPDIIHSHLHFGDILSHTYYYQNAKYFSHQHNSFVEEYKPINYSQLFNKRTWTNHYEFLWLKKRFKKHQTSFIACSAGTAEMLQDRIGFGKIITLPNAIPLPTLDYQYKTLPDDCIQLIWVGRFSNVKRPEQAIEIAKLLKEQKVDFQLKIIGHGDHFELCEKLIKSYQLEKQVELTGLVYNIDQYYKSANLMIHTATYEGLPMVFAEALSYGIPIISSDCMPQNEIITNGKNGYIVDTNDLSAYVRHIMNITQNKAAYQKFSQQAIESAQKFGIQQYVDQLLESYKA